MSTSGPYSQLALAQSNDLPPSYQQAPSHAQDVDGDFGQDPIPLKPLDAASPLLGDRPSEDWRARLTASVEEWVIKHEFGALVLLILATVMNNIGVQQMGYYMPIHSEFLLYGTTLFYTILFAFTAVLLKESWVLTKEQWIATFWLGLFTSLNGIFAQISIPYVDPEITTIVTQISAPVTWFVHIYMFSAKFTLFHLVSILVMFGGMIFGPLYSFWYGSGSDSTYTNGFWILITLAASIPTGFETLYQEKAYAILKAPKFVTLTYYNLFSFFWYFLWSFMTLINPFGTCVDGSPALEDCQFATRPCSLSEQVSHQRESWKCFITRDAVCCGDLSTLWVMVFVLGYYLSFAIGAFVLRVRDANSIANANAVSTPITSMFFWIPVVAGPSFSVFRWWIFLSFIAVAVGMWMYENHGYSQHRLNKTLINGKGPAHSEDSALANGSSLEQPLL